MNGEYVILPKDGLGFRLGKGQCMRVVDVEGQQVADVMAYHEKDFYEKFDQGATMDSLFSSKVKREISFILIYINQCLRSSKIQSNVMIYICLRAGKKCISSYMGVRT